MSKSLINFINKVNNITRAVNSINSTVRAVRTLRNQFRGTSRPSPVVRPTRPTGGSFSQPNVKPLGLSQIASTPTGGRNVNKRPVRPASRTDVGPKIR